MRVHVVFNELKLTVLAIKVVALGIRKMAKQTKDSGITTGIRVFKATADRLTMLAGAEGISVARLVDDLCEVQLAKRLNNVAPEMDKVKQLKNEIESLETKIQEKIRTR